jgi:phenylacetate-CoA ligase
VKIAERIYGRLPRAAQHAAATVQGALYYATRYAGAFHDQLALLKATEFAPADQLEELQNSALHDMVRFALAYVPYYRRIGRELGIDPQDARSVAGLQLFPVTRKDAVRERPQDFRPEYSFDEPLISWTTSGTTGKPLQLTYTRNAVRRLYAFVEIYREQAGLHRRSRRAQFTGKVIVPQTPREKVFWRYDLANNAMLLSLTHLHPDNLSAYLAALRAFQPEYVCGYPSAIALLAQQCLRERGLPLPLKAVLTTAETLHPAQRATIESAFSTRVCDQYGQAEMQSFWYECPSGSMHVHPLAGVTEILRDDGSPAAPGETGHVVLTGLLNRAMPFIRYRIGDMAARVDERCECGRRMPIIRRIDGRIEDYLYTRERGFVTRLDPAFKGISNIVESQLIQETMDRIVLRYVPAERFTEADLNGLLYRLRDRLGDGVEIAPEAVGSIPRGPNGKFRAVISHLPRELRSGLLAGVENSSAAA